jgi:hypothetical protein
VSGACRHSSKGAARRAAEIRAAWLGREDEPFKATTLDNLLSVCKPWGEAVTGVEISSSRADISSSAAG